MEYHLDFAVRASPWTWATSPTDFNVSLDGRTHRIMVYEMGQRKSI
jgi:hypothetical protein